MRWVTAAALAALTSFGCARSEKATPATTALEEPPAGFTGLEATAYFMLATNLLDAYKRKDLDAIAGKMPPEEGGALRRRLSPGGDLHKDYFGEQSWRWAVLQKWDGPSEEFAPKTRVGASEVWVGFAPLDGGKQVAVLELTRVGKKWLPKIERMASGDFDAWGRPAK
jgi:hypothetical protein